MNRNITIISICLSIILIFSYIYWTNTKIVEVVQPSDELNHLQADDSDNTDSELDVAESENQIQDQQSDGNGITDADKVNQDPGETNHQSNNQSQEQQTHNSNQNSTQDSDSSQDQEPTFKELAELPNGLIDIIGFVPVKYYQKGDSIYLLTDSGVKNDERTQWLKNSLDGGCSEVWVYDLNSKTLAKIFVKYDYASTMLEPEDRYGIPGASIFSIDNVDSNGNIFFTEQWGQGMMRYSSAAFQYVKASNEIRAISYQPARPEVYNEETIKDIENVVIPSKVVTEFYQVSKIINDDNGATSFIRFKNDKLYGVKYNLVNSDTGYYHKIGYFTMSTGKYTPFIQKRLDAREDDPFIYLDEIDRNGNITISEFDAKLRTHYHYYYNAKQRTITEKSSGEETNQYIVVEQ